MTPVACGSAERPDADVPAESSLEQGEASVHIRVPPLLTCLQKLSALFQAVFKAVLSQGLLTSCRCSFWPVTDLPAKGQHVHFSATVLILHSVGLM